MEDQVRTQPTNRRIPTERPGSQTPPANQPTGSIFDRKGWTTTKAPTSLEQQETKLHSGTLFPRPHFPPPPIDKNEPSANLQPGEPDLVSSKTFWNSLGRLREAPFIERTEETFRHSHWKEFRTKTLHQMVHMNLSPRRRWRFANCGSEAYVEHSPSTKRVRVRAFYCHDRFCRPCAATRARTICRNVARFTENRQTRFLTLTLRHYNAPLREQVERIYTCFARLRRHRYWKEKVSGGALFLEVKRSNCGRFWHPHLHVLITGKWIDKDVLKRCWLSVTGDSYIIDIRLPRQAIDTIRYITKYVTKPFDQSLFNNQDHLHEILQAYKGTRICATFGIFRGKPLEQETDDPNDWVRIDSLRNIWSAAREGQQRAISLLQLLHSLRPDWDFEVPDLDSDKSGLPPPFA